MTHQLTLNRRQMMIGSAAATLIVGLPSLGVSQAAGETTDATFGSFIQISQDGSITLVAPCFELGQGSQTGLAMILADELGADWSKVTVVGPDLDAEINTPGRTGQATAGSQSIRRWHDPLRTAAAAAREMLMSVALERLGTPTSPEALDLLTVKDSVISAGYRSFGFGELIADASSLPVPEAPIVRGPSGIVGTSVPRVDIPGKVNGTATFGIDVRPEGLVYAAIAQAPVHGSQIASVDATALSDAKIIKVVETDSAVMVVAKTFWAAKEAVGALKFTFTETAFDNISTADIMAAQRDALETGETSSPIEAGTARTRIEVAQVSGNATVVTSDYTVPFVHHMTMEPITCTVSIADGKCEVWVPTQDLTSSAKVAAETAGIPVENVTIHAIMAGGAFGRKFETDFVKQAVQAALQVDRPVQLIWTREEDVRHGFYRPAISARMTAAVAPNGDIDGLIIRVAGPSVLEHTIGYPLIKGSDPIAFFGVTTESGSAPDKLQQYTIPDFTAEFTFAQTHIRLGYWRAVGASENGFFIESFMDELAHAIGADPYHFRRQLLRESPRALAVLDKVAQEAGWGTDSRKGRTRGIAFSECVGSMVAQVAEVSVDDGHLRVHRIVAAIDCGTAINPDSVRAQIEGGITMGLSTVLAEEITIESGRVAQSNFHDYPIVGLAEAPTIEVHVINSSYPISGVGEAGVPSTAPAIANAVFAATGQRLRSLPLKVHS